MTLLFLAENIKNLLFQLFTIFRRLIFQKLSEPLLKNCLNFKLAEDISIPKKEKNQVDIGGNILILIWFTQTINHSKMVTTQPSIFSTTDQGNERIGCEAFVVPNICFKHLIL